MKKIILYLFMTLLLTGCTLEENHLENIIKSKIESGTDIYNSEAYIKYQEIDANEIILDGYVVLDDANEKAQEIKKAIHVTFSENANLNIEYYYDSNFEDVIMSSSYLNQEDSIYSNASVSDLVDQMFYELLEYRIYEFTDGVKKLKWTVPANDEGLVFKVPSDYNGKELSVEPVGIYKALILLEQPEYGGTIEYIYNGNTIENNQVIVPLGSSIQMKLNNWVGWKKIASNEEYLVHASGLQQTINVNDLAVDEVFIEDENHMPNLVITIDSSVGSETTFDIITTKDYDQGRSYEKGSLLDQVIGEYKAYEKKISTALGVEIFANGYFRPEKTLKFNYDKTDDENLVHSEIKYLDDLPNTVQYDIYDLNEIADSHVYYKTIDIYIDLVDKVTHKPVSSNNTNVSLSYIDTNLSNELKSDEVLDGNRLIKFVITPDVGYYLSDSNTDNGSYEKEMKYSKYLSKVNDMLSDHVAKKIYSVTLNKVDDYGTVEYILDGKKVSGLIDIREDQELVILYTITNEEYIIDRDQDKITDVFNKLKSKTIEEIDLEITKDLDGKTIQRSDYIKIKKK